MVNYTRLIISLHNEYLITIWITISYAKAATEAVKHKDALKKNFPYFRCRFAKCFSSSQKTNRDSCELHGLVT